MAIIFIYNDSQILYNRIIYIYIYNINIVLYFKVNLENQKVTVSWTKIYFFCSQLCLPGPALQDFRELVWNISRNIPRKEGEQMRTIYICVHLFGKRVIQHFQNSREKLYRREIIFEHKKIFNAQFREHLHYWFRKK